MARGKKKATTEEERALGEGSRHTIAAIVFVVVAAFLLIASRGIGGAVGSVTYKYLEIVFGGGYYLLPALSVIVGISFFRAGRPRVGMMNLIGGTVFLASGLGLVEMIFGSESGGWVGKGIEIIITKLFGKASWVILVALIIISLVVILDTKLSIERIKSFFRLRKEKREEPDDEYSEEEDGPLDDDHDDGEASEEGTSAEEEEYDENVEEDEIATEVEEKRGGGIRGFLGLGKKSAQKDHFMPYNAPPLSILGRDSGKPASGDVKANSNIIRRTLANFGVKVEMDEVSIGPSLTRYSMKPAEGMKLSKIVGLQNELSLALAAHPIRIEAPIPGKSLVGIEVPNSSKTTVGLGSMLSDDEFSTSPWPLAIGLGKSISGLTHFTNLAKAPHLLIAGTTGSGKSVTIHTLIAALLYRNGPDTLRCIFVDPKRVELTLYNNIPHLLTPVITQPKKAILALKWAAKEMDRRYDVLEEEGVRDIESYHKNVLQPERSKLEKERKKGLDPEEEEALLNELPESMPYIVIIIDELADIMSSYPRELEAAIVRLAQMSRAVGIHLILSTQRPSTEIITGLIKANIPTRIALQVPSQIDSRTILDAPGAEKLLGYGDMLFLGSDTSKPVRLQGAYISEDETKAIVKHIRSNNDAELGDDFGFSDEELDSGSGGSDSGDFDGEDGDDLYEDVRATVIELGKASTSLLQRKHRIGYARAARLIDMLEDRGIIGPGEGAKPREVYESKDSGSAVDDLADDIGHDPEEDNQGEGQ